MSPAGLNGFLLDTSIALLAVGAPEALSRTVRDAIERGPAYLSVVAYWEVAIKFMKGSLVVESPEKWFEQTQEAMSLIALPLRPPHVSTLLKLPPIHQDPFDRVLVAQALSERLVLLTIDATIPLYESSGLVVIR